MRGFLQITFYFRVNLTRLYESHSINSVAHLSSFHLSNSREALSHTQINQVASIGLMGVLLLPTLYKSGVVKSVFVTAMNDVTYEWVRRIGLLKDPIECLLTTLFDIVTSWKKLGRTGGRFIFIYVESLKRELQKAVLNSSLKVFSNFVFFFFMNSRMTN